MHKKKFLKHQSSLRNKFKIILFFLLLPVFHPGFAARGAEGNKLQLSLGETFGMIEAENFQILLEREAVEEALRTAISERSELLPQLEIQATQIRTKFVNVGRGFNFPDTPASNRFAAKVQGNMALFDVNKFANWRLSKFDYDLSKLNYENVLQIVLNDLTSTYFSHVRNQYRINLLDANIERDSLLLDLAKNQFDAGVATRIDVTRAEVQLATDRKERLQQDTVVMESALLIKRLLNLDLDLDLELEGMDPLEERPNRPYGLKVDHFLEDRPDYRQFSLELERNKAAHKFAVLASLPTVNVFGEWGYATSKILDGDEKGAWIAGISMNFPLFQGFRVRANKLRTFSLVRSREIALRDLELRVNADYRLAIQDVDSRFEQIKVSREKVELSEEELNLARTRFAEGVTDNRDVIDAQAKLAGSNDEYLESVFLYNIGRLTLARVRGDVRLILNE